MANEVNVPGKPPLRVRGVVRVVDGEFCFIEGFAGHLPENSGGPTERLVIGRVDPMQGCLATFQGKGNT